MKKYIIIIFSMVILGGGLFWYQNRQPDIITIDLPVAQDYQDFVDTEQPSSTEDIIEDIVEEDVVEEEIIEEVEEEIVEEEAPASSINLAVPFTSQAPTKNWEQPWQDACEEASILMVDYFYQNKDFPTPEQVEDILGPMVDWQIANWGGHYNLPVSKVAELVNITFGYQTQVIEDLDADKIKYWLNQGIPVVVPADGHKLANPHFTGDGPDYHMLVIKGYVDDKFITNDPGTQYGADFVYTSENLLYSIGNWDIQKTSAVGEKLGLVLLK